MSGKKLAFTISYPKILRLREKVRSHGKYLAFLASPQSKLNICEEELSGKNTLSIDVTIPLT